MTVMVISFILTILPVVGITQHFPACLVTTNTCRLPVWSKQSGHPPSLPDARYTNPCLGLLEMQDPMLEDVIQLAKVSQPGCKVVLMCVALCKQNTDRNERSMLASVMCFCQPCEIKACKLSAAVVLHCETKCGVSTSVLHMEIGRAVINTFEIALLFFFFCAVPRTSTCPSHV